ncbi:MAG: hypothetical protein CMI67_15400 [Pelagibaca sp.]|nr:hypothetical protein [Pelagibaca sp.]
MIHTTTFYALKSIISDNQLAGPIVFSFFGLEILLFIGCQHIIVVKCSIFEIATIIFTIVMLKLPTLCPAL